MLYLPDLEAMHEDVKLIEDIDFLSTYTEIEHARVIILGYLKISESENKRLDKIARELYGQHSFLEQIMRYNEILNANDVITGDVIALPDLGSMLNNTDIQEFQTKFIESNVTAFSASGDIIINGQSTLPNRRISTKKKFKVDVKNGVLVF